MENKKLFIEFSKKDSSNLKQKVLFSLGKENNLKNYLIGESKESVLAYLEFNTANDIKPDHFNHIATNTIEEINDKNLPKFITKILTHDSNPFSNFDHGSMIANMQEKDLFSLMKEQNIPMISVWKTFTHHDGKTKSGIHISYVDQLGKKHSIQSKNNQSTESLLNEMQQSLKEFNQEFNQVFNNFWPRLYKEQLFPLYNSRFLGNS